MSSKKWHNANNILDRLKEVKNLPSDASIADYLGKDPSTISTWRRRNTLDFATILEKCKPDEIAYIIYNKSIHRYPEAESDHSLTVNDDREPAYDTTHIESQISSLSDSLVDRIRHAPLSKDSKLKLIDAFLEIIEQDVQHAQQRLDSDQGDDSHNDS